MKTCFTNEKFFTVNPLWNSQNSQVQANVSKKSKLPQNIFCTEHQDHPRSAAISADVSIFDETTIYFVKP